MTIEWGKQAWDDVFAHTIIKCFMKQLKMMISPFESEEMMELQQVLTALGSEWTAEECIADENDVQVCSSPLDPSDPSWCETAKEEIVCDHFQPSSAKQACLTVESDILFFCFVSFSSRTGYENLYLVDTSVKRTL